MTIPTKDRNNANLDLPSTNIGGLEYPHSITTNPNGTPVELATQATLATLLTAAQAIQTAAEALNTKTSTVNTGAIVGTVEVANDLGNPLPTLVGNFPATQAISAVALPLPSGAASETTLAALNTKTPALGQANMAGASPVVLAADQPPVITKKEDVTASGNITTQNIVPAGVATTGSAVELILGGQATAAIQVAGGYTGALSVQVTINGTTWVTLGGTPLQNTNTGALSATIASAATGIFLADVAAYSRVRVTGLAAMTGSAAISIRASEAAALVAIDAALPAGSNSIGAVTLASTTITSISAGTNALGAVRLVAPEATTDVASAAITTTTTTAAFTPTAGVSYSINIPVTASSGTSQTLDLTVEESEDGGNNWRRVYDFPRITGTGFFTSPKLQFSGNRVRYAQTLGGTSPSFTRAINRVMSNEAARPLRQLVDRTVNSTMLSATTPPLNIQNCRNVQMVIDVGAATTAPMFQLEGSDDNGLKWYGVTGSPTNTAANGTVQITVSNVNLQLARARVSAAGAGVTFGYVLIKGF